jgi:hypothetical protein
MRLRLCNLLFEVEYLGGVGDDAVLILLQHSLRDRLRAVSMPHPGVSVSKHLRGYAELVRDVLKDGVPAPAGRRDQLIYVGIDLLVDRLVRDRLVGEEILRRNLLGNAIEAIALLVDAAIKHIAFDQNEAWSYHVTTAYW